MSVLPTTVTPAVHAEPGHAERRHAEPGHADRISRTEARDPFIDLVRAGALLVVVLWHWVFTSIRWSPDGPHVGNPVAATPGLWLLTWFLQIMPAFFIVGGYLHSRSLLDPTNDQSALAFIRRRMKRLIVPVLPLLITAGVLIALFASLGRQDLIRGVILIISPMWFLATYLVCILVAPLAARLHGRFGLSVVVAGAGAALFVDWLRIGRGVGGPGTGALSFVLVWATVHQIGFSLAGLRGAARSTQLGLAALGYSLLATAAFFGPYPAAMVGLDGHRLSNMGPPTAMVVFLAIGQLGLLCALAPVLGRFASGHQRLLSAMGRWSMTIYAWHLCAYAAFWFIAVRAGLSVGSRIDAAWWSQRPLWLFGPLVLAVPICRLTRRFDRVAR